jgi:spore germination cell wall hydrolase CwlJ-like protein
MEFDCESHKHDDVAALACNLYWEGRNQEWYGMIAIAAVTLWRVRSIEYPDTIAEVVWEKHRSRKTGKLVPQFSWTMDGKRDRPYINEKEQWDLAWSVARMFAISAEYKANICPHIATTKKMWDILKKKGVSVKRRHIQCKAYDTLVRSRYAVMEFLDPTNGSTMFHADYVSPYWKKAYTRVVKVGTHIFYRK